MLLSCPDGNKKPRCCPHLPPRLSPSLAHTRTRRDRGAARTRPTHTREAATDGDGVAGGLLVRGDVPLVTGGGSGGGGGAPVRGGGAASARRPGARRGGGRRPRGAPPHQGLREAPPQARRRRRPARRHATLRRARGWGGRAPRAAQPRRQGREVRTTA